MKLDWPLGAMKCNTSDFKRGLEILNVRKIPNNCRITEMLRRSKVCKYFHELQEIFLSNAHFYSDTVLALSFPRILQWAGGLKNMCRDTVLKTKYLMKTKASRINYHWFAFFIPHLHMKSPSISQVLRKLQLSVYVTFRISCYPGISCHPLWALICLLSKQISLLLSYHKKSLSLNISMHTLGQILKKYYYFIYFTGTCIGKKALPLPGGRSLLDGPIGKRLELWGLCSNHFSPCDSISDGKKVFTEHPRPAETLNTPFSWGSPHLWL